MALQKQKTVSESKVITTEIVMPNDTNPLHNLMGGHLLHLMDVAAAICARKHCNRVVVTASVDNVSFEHPVKLGSIITLEARITRSFNSSMEVYVVATGEDYMSGKKLISNKAFLTFVAVDQAGNPIAVPGVIPETEEDKELYESALRRRQLRLVLAGRLRPEEALELKSLFFKD